LPLIGKNIYWDGIRQTLSISSPKKFPKSEIHNGFFILEFASHPFQMINDTITKANDAAIGVGMNAAPATQAVSSVAVKKAPPSAIICFGYGIIDHLKRMRSKLKNKEAVMNFAFWEFFRT
jgi:hypothetical protein